MSKHPMRALKEKQDRIKTLERCKTEGCSSITNGSQLRHHNIPDCIIRIPKEDIKWGDGGYSEGYSCIICGDIIHVSV